jgi:hypothetical protein
MKLPNGGDAAECHLEKCHARGVVNVFRRKSHGGAVHHLPPGPKTVLFAGAAIFGATANHPLEGVGVSIDETGKYGAVALLFEVGRQEIRNLSLPKPLALSDDRHYN